MTSKTPAEIVKEAYPQATIVSVDGVTPAQALIAKYSGKNQAEQQEVQDELGEDNTSIVVIERPGAKNVPKSLHQQAIIVDKKKGTIVGSSG